MSNTVHTPLYASAIPGPLKVKQIWVPHGGLLGSISSQQTNPIDESVSHQSRDSK